MVDIIEKRIFEIISPANPRSWRTFKITPLTLQTSLNHTMNLDEEEAQDLLKEIFSEFGLNYGDLNFEVYFPVNNRKTAKPLTIAMLVEAAKIGRWQYG